MYFSTPEEFFADFAMAAKSKKLNDYEKNENPYGEKSDGIKIAAIVSTVLLVGASIAVGVVLSQSNSEESVTTTPATQERFKFKH